MNLLIDSALKVSLIVLLAFAATILLRRQSAALRHWILSAAIVCSAAVPFLGLIVPSWQVTFAPSALQRVESAAIPAAEPSRVSAPGAMPLPAMRRDVSGAARVTNFVASAWVVGFVISALLLLVGFARLTWLASGARRLSSGRWFEVAADICREYELRRPVVLLQSAHPALLVTWGLLRPRILLPATAAHWAEDRIRIVLRHEIAHIRRHDWLVHLVAELVRSAYWFNPLVWMVCRRLRDESEHACDDVVLTRGVEPSAYASQLLALARMFATERRSWSAAPAMARPCSLERRISAMFSTRANRTPMSRAARLATGLAAVSFTAAIAGAAFAQAGTARFSGSVTDPSGAPLPDTTISLTHRQTTVGHATPSDQSGYFEFGTLPPGEYSIEARTPGFAPLRDTITLAAGENVRRDIRLNVGTVEETISVGAGTGAPRPPKDPGSVRSFVEKLRGKRLQPPIKLKDVRPIYSQALRDAGIEGRVILEGRIATDGSITGMRVITSAHDELLSAARDAASQWRFEPTRLWGTPIEVGITMTFDFRNGQ